ncbi:MAG: hypothetical protein IPL83_15725 [Bdellovibrionales bacterium]|nr:hypothetical protein [Bdellovibrionales bacterium]
MPDTASVGIAPVCYDGKLEVVLDNGSTATIYGQIFYVDGQYTFTW